MSCEHDQLEEYMECAKVGQPVRDVSLTVFDTTEGGFGEVSMGEIQRRAKGPCFFSTLPSGALAIRL